MGSLFKKPKVREQKATPQEKALTRRQDEALSREIADENRRKKALFRNTLGDVSLLSGLTSAGPVGAGGSTFTGIQFAPASGGKSASLLSSGKAARPSIPRDFR